MVEKRRWKRRKNKRVKGKEGEGREMTVIPSMRLTKYRSSLYALTVANPNRVSETNEIDGL